MLTKSKQIIISIIIIDVVVVPWMGLGLGLEGSPTWSTERQESVQQDDERACHTYTQIHKCTHQQQVQRSPGENALWAVTTQAYPLLSWNSTMVIQGHGTRLVIHGFQIPVKCII